MEEALKDDVLITSSTCVVNTPETAGPAGGGSCIRRDVARIVLGGVGKEFVVFTLSAR